MKTLLPLILFVAISSCDVSFESGTSSMQTFQGAGITFVVPLETNSISHGDFGIKYESDTIKAETNGKGLLINNIDYGSVDPGDTVDFSNPEVILVNEKERKPNT